MSIRQNRRVVRKTANYTIGPNESAGTLFTNGGAVGAVIFTLPPPNASLLGVWYGFLGLVDQLITVQTLTSDTLIGFNDVDLDSIGLGGSGQRIGASLEIICVEQTQGVYRWAVYSAGTNGVTYALTD